MVEEIRDRNKNYRSYITHSVTTDHKAKFPIRNPHSTNPELVYKTKHKMGHSYIKLSLSLKNDKFKYKTISKIFL